MDLKEHEELVSEVLPQGVRAPAFLIIGAAVCLMQALSGLFCDPHDAKLGQFANLDPNWSSAVPSMIAVGGFGAIFLGMTFGLSRQRPLLSMLIATVGYTAIVVAAGIINPGALSVTVYLVGHVLMVGLLVAGCVVAAREEAKIRRALEHAERTPPDLP